MVDDDELDDWYNKRHAIEQVIETWRRAASNAPHKKGMLPCNSTYSEVWASKCEAVGRCVGRHVETVYHSMEAGKKLNGERWQMVVKLASPEYGRVFAAIRLTALGVADQYDWDDK